MQLIVRPWRPAHSARRSRRSALAASVLLAAGFAAPIATPPAHGANPAPGDMARTGGTPPAASPAPLAEVRIGLPQAIEAARQVARGGVPLRAALRRQGDGAATTLVWTIRLLVEDREREVTVAAGSGHVVGSRDALMTPARRTQLDSLRPLLAKAEIGLADAGRLVAERVEGSQVVKAEVDIENGRLQYDVSVRSADGLFAAEVDAITGDIGRIVGSRPTAQPDPPPAAIPSPKRENFDELRPGTLPKGWLATGPGDASGAWAVAIEEAAASPPNVLATSGSPRAAPLGRLCHDATTPIEDGTIEAAVRITGRPAAAEQPADEGAGVAWRIVDGRNFHRFRVDPSRSTIALEVVRDGIVEILAEAKVELASEVWHRLRVRHLGDRIECSVGDRATLTTRDSTRSVAGGFGFWSGPTTPAQFDDLRAERAASPQP
ncbi:MAG TPA: hypothetical protein PKC43_03005 [Phycisphaerales bacterium]|nr:hypothetical protein [Phycisphaerales bacterium]HMP36396.1 hypothetical protein [Phycisphaerales bacterium]